MERRFQIEKYVGKITNNNISEKLDVAVLVVPRRSNLERLPEIRSVVAVEGGVVARLAGP